MPIYEFVCEACRSAFESFVPRVGAKAPCPKCGSENVERAISRPCAPPTSSNAPSAGGCPAGG